MFSVQKKMKIVENGIIYCNQMCEHPLIAAYCIESIKVYKFKMVNEFSPDYSVRT